MRTRVWLLLVALLMVGCATDELPTLALVGFHGLKVEDEGCTYTDAQMSSSTYDTGLATTYGQPFNVYVHLRNELNALANPDVGQVEANRVEVRSMRVTFEGEDWSELPAPIELPVTGMIIDPDGDYWSNVTPITTREAAIFDRQFSTGEGEVKDLRIRLSFSGTTSDGSYVESNGLSYLVRVCRGCVSCPSGQVMRSGCAMAFAQADGVVCEEVEDPFP